MPYIILRPTHGLDKLISHLGVCHYITKTHLGGQDTLQRPYQGTVGTWIARSLFVSRCSGMSAAGLMTSFQALSSSGGGSISM
jgi:hypothetical protein